MIKLRKATSKAHLKFMRPRDNFQDLTILAKDHIETQNISDRLCRCNLKNSSLLWLDRDWKLAFSVPDTCMLSSLYFKTLNYFFQGFSLLLALYFLRPI